MNYEQIRERLRYDPTPGELYWIGGPRDGQVARGYIATDGYRMIRLVTYTGKKNIRAHRIAVSLAIGRDLDRWEIVDHLNGDKLDNRLENLRLCTQAENAQNSKLYKNNRTGYRGVVVCRYTGRFVAQIFQDGKSIHLGTHDSPEDAHAAYIKASRELGWEVMRSVVRLPPPDEGAHSV
jgi:hypothetical protein